MHQVSISTSSLMKSFDSFYIARVALVILRRVRIVNILLFHSQSVQVNIYDTLNSRREIDHVHFRFPSIIRKIDPFYIACVAMDILSDLQVVW